MAHVGLFNRSTRLKHSVTYIKPMLLCIHCLERPLLLLSAMYAAVSVYNKMMCFRLVMKDQLSTSVFHFNIIIHLSCNSNVHNLLRLLYCTLVHYINYLEIIIIM